MRKRLRHAEAVMHLFIGRSLRLVAVALNHLGMPKGVVHAVARQSIAHLSLCIDLEEGRV